MSIQTILRDRQKDEFVGRIDQLTDFTVNLDPACPPERRRYVFCISGPAGIGKTSLLRRLSGQADASRWRTVWVDERAQDTPAAMSSIVDSLAHQPYPFSEFKERYKTYRTKRSELEADPEAPKGIPTLLGKTIVKESLRLAKQFPIAGAVADAIDESAASSVVGDAISYVYRRIASKDDVELVLSPAEVLTPLLLKDLNPLCTEAPVALVFDTYEQSGLFLDPWLRRLLDGNYGELTAKIAFLIGGQSELDRNAWTPYESLVTRWPLEVFSHSEVRDYMVKRGVSDPKRIATVNELSGGLPLLVATLASTRMVDSSDGEDSRDVAVARFLKWIDSEQRRQFVLQASLPRVLNAEIVALLDVADATSFAWLKTLPFIAGVPSGIRYHEVVRTHLVRQARLDAPGRWHSAHGLIAEHYRNAAGPEGAVERAYHLLCQDSSHLTAVVEDALRFACSGDPVARDYVRAMATAGVDADNVDVVARARAIGPAVEALLGQDAKAVQDVLLPLSLETPLDSRVRAELLFAIAVSVSQQSLHEEAREYLLRAIELDPKRSRYWRVLGNELLKLQSHDDAYVACTSALELDDHSAYAYLTRGRCAVKLRRIDSAIGDFSRVLELDTRYAHQAHRGMADAYRQAARVDEEVAALKSALTAEGDCVGCWTALSDALHRQNPRSQIADLLGATARLASSSRSALGAKAVALARYDRQAALDQLSALIESGEPSAELLAYRGELYRRARRPSDAEADLSLALDLDPKAVAALRSRASVYRSQGRFAEAANDLGSVMALDPELRHTALSRIGELQLEMSEWRAAGETFSKALELLPACSHCWWGLASSYREALTVSNVRDLLGQVPSKKLSSFWVQIQQGIGLHHAGFHGEGVGVLEEAVSAGSQEAWKYLRRADAYTELWCFDQALDDHARAATLDGAIKVGFANARGLLRSYLGDFVGACEEFSSQKDDLVKLYNWSVAAVRGGMPDADDLMSRTRRQIEAERSSDPARAKYAEAGLLAVTGSTPEACAALGSVLIGNVRLLEFVLRDMAWADCRTDRALVETVTQCVDLETLTPPERRALGLPPLRWPRASPSVV